MCLHKYSNYFTSDIYISFDRLFTFRIMRFLEFLGLFNAIFKTNNLKGLCRCLWLLLE